MLRMSSVSLPLIDCEEKRQNKVSEWDAEQWIRPLQKSLELKLAHYYIFLSRCDLGHHQLLYLTGFPDIIAKARKRFIDNLPMTYFRRGAN